MPPLVTVITPAYNVAGYIGEAVDSVLRQTFTDFEYIVADDGSEDDSARVAEAHAAGDPRFRLVRGEHRGASAARNAGLRQARGRYVAFLDGDDRWHPAFLERQVSLIESVPEDVGLVFCRSRMILENGTPVFFQRQRAGRYDFDDFLVRGNPARNGSSLLIRRSCFDDVGCFDEALYGVEDLEMWLRIADRSKTPVLWGSGDVLVDLRLRPGSVTRDRSAGDQALWRLLEEQVPKLRSAPAGLAYVRPALQAFKYGVDDALAVKMCVLARSAGLRTLVRSLDGWRFLLWASLTAVGRGLLRRAQRGVREAVKSANLALARLISARTIRPSEAWAGVLLPEDSLAFDDTQIIDTTLITERRDEMPARP